MVIVGHLGKFTLSLHWMNLGNQPVEILIEDVYLLVVPSAESTYDAEEEEKRIQATKFERLQNAELLHIQGKAEQAQGLYFHVYSNSALLTGLLRRPAGVTRSDFFIDCEGHQQLASDGEEHSHPIRRQVECARCKLTSTCILCT